MEAAPAKHHSVLGYLDLSLTHNMAVIQPSFFPQSLKMESASKMTIFGQKMMLKSDVEKIFLNSLFSC